MTKPGAKPSCCRLTTENTYGVGNAIATGIGAAPDYLSSVSTSTLFGASAVWMLLTLADLTTHAGEPGVSDKLSSFRKADHD